jgi:hypothetical protein
VTTLLAQAALPTARTIHWWPLALVVAPLAGLVLLARDGARPAEPVLLLVAAALASVVVTALRDEAASTLEAVPVPIVQRRALRLALVGVPVLVVWWALTSLVSTGRPATASLLALAACGVAVATRGTSWGSSRWWLLAGTAVPVLWFALDRLLAGRGSLGDALGWWRTDPWPLLAAAVVALALGSRR